MNYIDELKNKLFPIFKNYNVKEAILFGSFAKVLHIYKKDDKIIMVIIRSFNFD